MLASQKEVAVERLKNDARGRPRKTLHVRVILENLIPSDCYEVGYCKLSLSPHNQLVFGGCSHTTHDWSQSFVVVEVGFALCVII